MTSVWILMDKWDEGSSIVSLHSSENKARVARLREIQTRRQEQPSIPIKDWVQGLCVFEMTVN